MAAKKGGLGSSTEGGEEGRYDGELFEKGEFAVARVGLGEGRGGGRVRDGGSGFGGILGRHFFTVTVDRIVGIES